MQQAALIRLRPRGPWRFGPGEGGQDRVDTLYRSDRLYSAVTIAMKQLGMLDEWLDATVHSTSPAVAFTSLFPFQGDTLFAPPPSSLWPPPSGLLTTPSPVFLAKIRWTAARFVPVSLIESILLGQKVLADQWVPDPETACLLRRDRPSTSPFHVVVKTRAAVDRTSNSSVHVHSAACVEFEPGAGLWTVARYPSDEARAQWDDRVRAAFRLLGDTGFGGGRSSGWGQAEAPEFQAGAWPGVLMPKLARKVSRTATPNVPDVQEPSLFWMLSLFSPSKSDAVNWREGDYAAVVRGGRIESSAGGGAEKKRVRMIAEGSVLVAESEPVGAAVDVAPDNFAHPVYRSGFAVALRLPVMEIAAEQETVETPAAAEAVEPTPCEQPEAERAPEPEPVLEPEPVREPEPEVEAEPLAEPEAETEAQAEPTPPPQEASSEGTPEESEARPDEL